MDHSAVVTAQFAVGGGVRACGDAVCILFGAVFGFCVFCSAVLQFCGFSVVYGYRSLLSLFYRLRFTIHRLQAGYGYRDILVRF